MPWHEGWGAGSRGHCKDDRGKLAWRSAWSACTYAYGVCCCWRVGAAGVGTSKAAAPSLCPPRACSPDAVQRVRSHQRRLADWCRMRLRCHFGLVMGQRVA